MSLDLTEIAEAMVCIKYHPKSLFQGYEMIPHQNDSLNPFTSLSSRIKVDIPIFIRPIVLYTEPQNCINRTVAPHFDREMEVS